MQHQDLKVSPQELRRNRLLFIDKLCKTPILNHTFKHLKDIFPEPKYDGYLALATVQKHSALLNKVEASLTKLKLAHARENFCKTEHPPKHESYLSPAENRITVDLKKIEKRPGAFDIFLNDLEKSIYLYNLNVLMSDIKNSAEEKKTEAMFSAFPVKKRDDAKLSSEAIREIKNNYEQLVKSIVTSADETKWDRAVLNEIPVDRIRFKQFVKAAEEKKINYVYRVKRFASSKQEDKILDYVPRTQVLTKTQYYGTLMASGITSDTFSLFQGEEKTPSGEFIPIVIKDIFEQDAGKITVNLAVMKFLVDHFKDKYPPYLMKYKGLTYFEEVGKTLSVIMDNAEQGSLDDFLETFYKTNLEKIDNRILLKIAYGVACGLVDLHKLGIVHNDLRAPHIYLDKNLTAKISGFTRVVVHRLWHEIGDRFTAADAHGTAGTGQNTAGPLAETTPLAPESFYDDSIPSVKGDIYAFGMLLRKLFFKPPYHAPFKGVKSLGILSLKKQGRTEFVPDDCPVEIQELIKKCLERVPEDRPKAIEVAEELRKLLLKEKEFKCDLPITSSVEYQCRNPGKYVAHDSKKTFSSSREELLNLLSDMRLLTPQVAVFMQDTKQVDEVLQECLKLKAMKSQNDEALLLAIIKKFSDKTLVTDEKPSPLEVKEQKSLQPFDIEKFNKIFSIIETCCKEIEEKENVKSNLLVVSKQLKSLAAIIEVSTSAEIAFGEIDAAILRIHNLIIKPGKEKIILSLAHTLLPPPKVPKTLPEFLCPLSGLKMKKPVITSSGHTFDFESLKNYFNKDENTLKKANSLLLENKEIVFDDKDKLASLPRNFALTNLIDIYDKVQKIELDDLECPLLFVPMENPVTLSSGHTIDQQALGLVRKKNNEFECPFTRVVLIEHGYKPAIIPNRILKKIVDQHQLIDKPKPKQGP